MTQQGFSFAPVRTSAPGGAPQSDPQHDLAPWRPTASDPWDARKARHLLRRAGFGGTPEEVEAAVKIGVDRMVDILVTPSRDGLQEFGTRVLPNGELVNLSYDVNAQRAQWLFEMAHTFYPLKEKMALFWHDHFSVGAENFRSFPLLNAHINLFRRLGLGRLRDLLIAVTKDPAMQWWLDNYLNGRPVRGQPKINENYGRELLELYTVGVDNGYTQRDVVEASKALSGWGLVGINRFLYRDSWHVKGPKTVMGKTFSNPTNGMKDGFDLIDVILASVDPATRVPRCAKFLTTKIWRYFVNEDVTKYDKTINLLATRFAEDGYDIRALMSTILRSNVFYSADSVRQLVKNPVEFAVGALRNTGQIVNLGGTVRRFRNVGIGVEFIGYPLLRYQNPAGLEDGMAWISSQAVIGRANYANEITQVNTYAGVGNRFSPTREIARKNLRTDRQIVDHFLDILVDGDVPAAVRTKLYDFMNRDDNGPRKFNINDPALVSAKVRGLVHLIMALPEYQIN